MSRVSQKAWIVVLLSFWMSTAIAQTRFETPQSFHFVQTPLKQVVQEISAAWEVSFLYGDSLIGAHRVINFHAENVTLAVCLTQLCEENRLQYRLKNEKVLLRPQKEPPERAEVFGFLRDGQANLPLPGGVVFIAGTRLGTITGNDGDFRISQIPPGPQVVTARLLGYGVFTDTVYFQPGDAKRLEIDLQPKEIELDEAILIADRITDPTTVSEVILKREDLKIVQGLSADPLRTLTTLPGIEGNGGLYGTSNLSFRGGLPEESLYLFDNAPMLSPWHVTGISVFNTDVIEKLEVLTAGYPASYGNSMSGVVNVTTREGDMQDYSGLLAIDQTNTRGLIEGPIWKDKISFIVGGRRALINRFFPQDGNLYPNFNDFSFKLSSHIGNNHKLSFSGHNSWGNLQTYRDSLRPGLPDTFRFTGNSANLTLQWQGSLSEDLYHKFSFTGSLLKSNNLAGSVLDQVSTQGGGVIRDDFTLFLGSHNKVRAGWEYAEVRNGVSGFSPLDPFATDYADSTQAVRPHEAFEWPYRTFGIYWLYDGKIGKHFVTNTGLRYDFRDYGQEGKFSPRISLAWLISSRAELRASYGIYRQNPDFRGLFGNQELSSGRAVHYVLGYKYRLPSSLQFWAEAYWKSYSDLTVFNENLEYSTDGFGHAYGLEVYVRKEAGRFRGWVSYAYANSRRQGSLMDSIGFAPYDRRHSLSLVGEYRIGHKSAWVPARVGGNFVLTSGTPYTPITGVDNSMQPPIGIVGAPFSLRNTFRDNLTVHLEWERYFGNKKQALFLFSLEVWNVYNQRNIAGRAYAFEPNVQEQIYYDTRIFPWIGMEMRFP